MAPLKTFANVVDDFIRRFRPAIIRERAHYIDCSFKEAVRRASYAETLDGKRHPHHCRRSHGTLAKVAKRLRRVNLARASSFDDLLQMMEGAIRRIDGIGDLFIYDASVNIGANLRIEPERVYLHRGTKAGALAMGLGVGRSWLDVDELPRVFSRLAADEIESCLCIYKDVLARVRHRQRVSI
jgi:hypothetical protein